MRNALLERGVAVDRTPITPDYLLAQLLGGGEHAVTQRPLAHLELES
ncbi:MAG: hypothetical protein KAF64_08000 [Hydrogenophaga sp.]|nr:hypothetical protein [Hydrogenophaga sp.]MBU7573279.1 hypothetical protein [Hydrogenophaga sp.]